MISRVLLYLLMITSMLIQGSSKEVKWIVRDTSPMIGQDLTLFCKVDKCTLNEIIKGWRGGPDDKVLMANSGISTNKTKYNTSIDKHGFILTILNLTVKDLNVSYECSCGFYLDKHILYIDVYKADNLNKSSNGTNYVGTTDVGVKYGYIAIPVILVILLIIVIVIKRHWLWKKLKEKIYGPRRRNSGSSLTSVHVDFNQRQSSDEVDSQNVTKPLLQTTHEDSNLRQREAEESLEPCTSRKVSNELIPTIVPLSETGSFHSAEESLEPCTSRKVSNELIPTIVLLPETGFCHSDRGNFEQSIFIPVHQPTNEDPLRSAEDDIPRQSSRTVCLDLNPRQSAVKIHVDNNPRPRSDLDDNLHGNELLEQPQESINRVTAAESFEPSTSQEASSEINEVKQIAVSTLPIQRTSHSIIGTERRESPKTNSRRLPNKPSSFTYINHRDDPASTRPGKKYIESANIELRENIFTTWPLNIPTTVQLAEAECFHSGDKNIAQYFRCENKIYCNEGLDPLDEAFHNKCEYLGEITSTQSQWLCIICDDLSFDKRWSAERHVLERHSPFGWNCPSCKKLFPRRNTQHGCKVEEADMICFDNITGQRGLEAEEALEKYKKEEVAKKLKHFAEDGTEVPIRPRRNYAMSERSVKATSDRSARTSLSTTIMTDKEKADDEHPVNKKAKTLERSIVSDDNQVSEYQARNVMLTPATEEIDTYLKYLQDCQENMIILNIGGVKFETSKPTMRADPSSVFAIMLRPHSPFRPCSNIYSFDRDPAHFNILLNYLRNNCCIEKRYLPREHHYLNEIATEAKFYKLFGLKCIVEEKLNDLCACRLSTY